MKFIGAGLVAISLGLLAVGAISRNKTEASQTSHTPAPQGTRTPVIVELFTSEGCSSCPPADTNLAKLEEKQPVGSAEIIALEEHVDYWNNLGWADPFSGSEWTARQESYAETFRNGSVYTPQMVVDGTTEFVGSREREARQTIEQAARQAKASVNISAIGDEAGGSRKFNVQVGRLAAAAGGDTAEVWLAVTETQLHSNVTRGENAGEDLHHAAVVRALRRLGSAGVDKDLSFAGETNVSINSSWKRENLRVVVFVQEKNSRRILGAAAAQFSQPTQVSAR
jgi:hypothetical protein